MGQIVGGPDLCISGSEMYALIKILYFVKQVRNNILKHTCISVFYIHIMSYQNDVFIPSVARSQKILGYLGFFLYTVPGTESLSQLPFKIKYLAIIHVTNQEANRNAKKQNI